MAQQHEKMSLEDWLDDLCVRFIINLPADDLSTVARIGFHVEEAHWFYEDFIRPLDPTLPNMSLRTFTMRIFQHCPLFASFSEDSFLRAFDEFMQYKTRIPVRGAIMLNQEMDSAVLVRGWKSGAAWSFPRGKINKDENDLDCAVREVYEETGYNIQAAGLIPEDRNVKYVETAMHGQQVRLYVFRGIPIETPFETRTRKEIGKIAWYKLQDLPAYRKKDRRGNASEAATNANKFYMVAPFLVQLRKWVTQQRNRDRQLLAVEHGNHLIPAATAEEGVTDDDGLIPNPLQQTTDSPAPSPGSMYMDTATKELHRQLDVQSRAEALQLPPHTAASGANAAALMSILQPKSVAGQIQPHAPQDLALPEVVQPHAPQPQAMPQKAYFPSYEQPYQSFAIPKASIIQPQQQQQSSQQYHARPHVQMTLDANGHQTVHVSPRHHPQQSIQLIHPQPQPPQVQQSLLLRDILPTPVQPERTVAPSDSHSEIRQGHQPAQHLSRQEPSGSRTTPPPTAHAMSLLNVFKNSSAGQVAQPVQAQPQALPAQIQQSSGHNIKQQLLADSSRHAAQGSRGAPFAAAHNTRGDAVTVKSLQPQSMDHHRSSLLGMFKETDATKDGSSGTIPRKEPLPTPPAHRISSADVMRVAAKDRGRPIQTSSDLNLPFGALSIASRPKAGKMPSTPPMATPLSHVENASQVRHASSGTYSASADRDKESEYRPTRPSGRLATQAEPAIPQRLGYPYGGASEHSVAGNNPLLQAPGAPAHSASSMRPRPQATAEQQKTLLSLFGKSDRSTQQTAPDAADHGSRGSVSSRPDSRKGSQTPLSPADRQFLLGYLQDASKNAKH